MRRSRSCGPYFSRQSSLDMALRRWEVRVPKMDIWSAILTWVKCKLEKFEQKKRDHDHELSQFKLELWELETNRDWVPACDYRVIRRLGFEREIQAVEQEIQAVEQEIQALEMIHHWIRCGGKEALKRAEYVLDGRDRDQRTQVEQHIEQLLELMEQDYWRTQEPQMSCRQGPDRSMSVSSLEKVFRTLRKEIPELLGMHQGFGLRNSTLLETRFSTTLDKILRLSSWTPSSAHNTHLRELLMDALVILNNLSGIEEYHDCLRDFMKRHTAFCAFTLDNADLIANEDSQTTAVLCRNLRRLAQNLGKIASTKADRYQKLYENFIANKEDLSHWLDSASPGQGKPELFISGVYLSPATYFILVGRSLVDNFTDSLKDMASSMRQESNFWKSQSNQFHKWSNIRQTYGCAIDAMPPEQPNDHRSSTTPPNHGSDTQVNLSPDFFILM